MVNILFISDNDKLGSVVKSFQERLKVKLDVANDFDLGLKDVFEKRPAFVFIQDHIAGVTGESVARHIQMLLGTSSPQFVLLHEGAHKLKPIKSLYDYLLDLSHPESKIMSDIQELLQILLGEHWNKVYVPQVSSTVSVPLHSATSEVLSKPDREVADRLVDDLLSELDTKTSTSQRDSSSLQDFSDPTLQEPFHIVSSPHDQLADLLAATANSVTSPTTIVAPSSGSAPAEKYSGEFSWEVPGPSDSSIINKTEMNGIISSTTPGIPADPPRAAFSSDSDDNRVALLHEATVSSPPHPCTGQTKEATTGPAQLSPADFFIDKERAQPESSTDELPASFRVTYDSSKARNRNIYFVITVGIICSFCAFWLLYSRGLIHFPQVISTFFHGKQPAGTLPAVQPIRKPAPGGVPTFVPIAGHDPSFSAGRPGWERYAGSAFEVRLFRQGEKLKAVQVIAAQGRSISEPLLRSILNELAGDGSFNETAQDQKHGFQVSYASAARNTEMLIYRKQKAIQAVVFSFE